MGKTRKGHWNIISWLYSTHNRDGSLCLEIENEHRLFLSPFSVFCFASSFLKYNKYGEFVSRNTTNIRVECLMTASKLLFHVFLKGG